jgi:6,7-dimethyl-8-ribityllumazine synthase
MVKIKKNALRHMRGSHIATGKRFAVVVSRFNEYLTAQLLQGALETFLSHGAREKDILVVHVPGAFEMPLAVQKILKRGPWDAVLTLAVVIRGKTKHFEQVVVETAKGVRQASLMHDTPVILGVIPATHVQDAIERVGLKQMNKGREWALSAIEMADLSNQLKGKKR